MEFTLQDDYIELIKVLKIVNLVASGGEAKLVVADGLVMVNDEVELRKRRKLRKGDVITFKGEEVTIV